MSQENVEIVRREVAARNARDWTVLAEIWHPEIEIEVVSGLGTLRGLDEIREFFDGLSNLYSEYRVDVDEILDAGDSVVTVERIAGRGLKGSDAEAWLQESLFRLVGFKDGRIWRVKEYPSRERALEAAGLPRR
jgi:ketosteroid isomerase-like protein